MTGNPVSNPWSWAPTEQAENLQSSFVNQRSGKVIQLRGGEYAANSAALPLTGSLLNESVKEEVMADQTRDDELLKARLGTVAAETDTKIARIEGKLDTIAAMLGSKLDTVNEKLADQTRDRNLIIGTIVLAALAVIGAFIGLASYGDALFGRGMDVRDVVQAVLKEQQQIQPPLPHH